MSVYTIIALFAGVSSLKQWDGDESLQPGSRVRARESYILTAMVIKCGWTMTQLYYTAVDKFPGRFVPLRACPHSKAEFIEKHSTSIRVISRSCTPKLQNRYIIQNSTWVMDACKQSIRDTCENKTFFVLSFFFFYIDLYLISFINYHIVHNVLFYRLPKLDSVIKPRK